MQTGCLPFLIYFPIIDCTFLIFCFACPLNSSVSKKKINLFCCFLLQFLDQLLNVVFFLQESHDPLSSLSFINFPLFKEKNWAHTMRDSFPQQVSQLNAKLDPVVQNVLAIVSKLRPNLFTSDAGVVIPSCWSQSMKENSNESTSLKNWAKWVSISMPKSMCEWLSVISQWWCSTADTFFCSFVMIAGFGSSKHKSMVSNPPEQPNLKQLC